MNLREDLMQFFSVVGPGCLAVPFAASPYLFSSQWFDLDTEPLGREPLGLYVIADTEIRRGRDDEVNGFVRDFCKEMSGVPAANGSIRQSAG
jgi:hypothetical protein